MPVKIFFCYAREDEALLNKLTEWKREIDKYLSTAHIILLLISPDFMNSDYCWSVEMERALERHKDGKACVIPIILRPVYWQGTPLGTLQALPKDGKPVTDPDWYSEDRALYDVAEGIRQAIEQPNFIASSRPLPPLPKREKKPHGHPSPELSEVKGQQKRFAQATLSQQELPSSSSYPQFSSSTFNHQAKWIMQIKNLLLSYYPGFSIKTLGLGNGSF